jgi:hypothetical protein
MQFVGLLMLSCTWLSFAAGNLVFLYLRETIVKGVGVGWVSMVHTCNPYYLGG